jgi:cell division protein FtsZ
MIDLSPRDNPMPQNLNLPQMAHLDFAPRITIIGVGGAGISAVDTMIGADLQRVEFIVADSDARQLSHTRATHRIQLGTGREITAPSGATLSDHVMVGEGPPSTPLPRSAPQYVDGGPSRTMTLRARTLAPKIGTLVARDIYRILDGVHLVFIVAGMGGGTGTVAAPIIARMAQECGILTVGVVTKPFAFEGSRRARIAEDGIATLQQQVDTLIVIPNEKLLTTAPARITRDDAFKLSDHAMHSGVSRVTDLLLRPPNIGIDFADVRTVIARMGIAVIGTGQASGENRAIRAAELAITDPLLDDTDFSDAAGLLISFIGGEDATLFEVDQAATRIRRAFDDKATVVFGWTIDESMTGRLSVAIVVVALRSTGATTAHDRLTSLPRRRDRLPT